MNVTIEILEERIRSIPEALTRTLSVELPSDEVLRGAPHGFDVVGVGGSEFPARIFAHVLSAAGLRARFCPVSGFLRETGAAPDTQLVVFSQGLSPNSQLALARSDAYRSALLFTALDRESSGPRAQAARACSLSIQHPPQQESGGLVRFVGPVCATLVALHLAARIIKIRCSKPPSWVEQLPLVPHRYGAVFASEQTQIARHGASPPASAAAGALHPVACLALGHEITLAQGLMWKWQEALYTPLPRALDVLAFAHGPFQSFYDKRAEFFALVPEGEAEIFARLNEALQPENHTVRALTSTLPFPLSLFEYDAQLNALVLEQMRARKIDPQNWPGKFVDKPLYSICQELPNSGDE